MIQTCTCKQAHFSGPVHKPVVPDALPSAAHKRGDTSRFWDTRRGICIWVAPFWGSCTSSDEWGVLFAHMVGVTLFADHFRIRPEP
jgi:hypothetical protein